MQRFGPAQGPSYRWRGAAFSGVLFLLFSTTLTHGQDLAQAARQERARKAAQPNAPKHVYTDEELKRQKILTLKDQAKVEARKKQQSPAPAEQNAEVLPGSGNPQTKSLGEVARRYRREKAARVAESAEKKKFAPFPYALPEESLAGMKPGVAPPVEPALRVDSGEAIVPFPSVVPHSLPQPPHLHSRISPFQPRPFVATPRAIPTRPVVPAVAPKVFSPLQIVEPVAAAPVPPSPHAATPVVVPSAPSSPAKTTKEVGPAPISTPPPVERTGLLRVQVQRGDSWWKLAEQYLGSGTRWQELRELNGELLGAPDLLKSDSIVVVPESVRRSKTSPPQSITAKKGDTLWALAREHLGRGSAWTCLAQINPEVVDYTHLKIGTPILLPADGALDSCQGGIVHTTRK